MRCALGLDDGRPDISRDDRRTPRSPHSRRNRVCNACRLAPNAAGPLVNSQSTSAPSPTPGMYWPPTCRAVQQVTVPWSAGEPRSTTPAGSDSGRNQIIARCPYVRRSAGFTGGPSQPIASDSCGRPALRSDFGPRVGPAEALRFRDCGMSALLVPQSRVSSCSAGAAEYVPKRIARLRLTISTDRFAVRTGRASFLRAGPARLAAVGEHASLGHGLASSVQPDGKSGGAGHRPVRSSGRRPRTSYAGAFTARPDRVWCSDPTGTETREGRMHLATSIGLFSPPLVGLRDGRAA